VFSGATIGAQNLPAERIANPLPRFRGGRLRADDS
jgi:hypothetical protein